MWVRHMAVFLIAAAVLTHAPTVLADTGTIYHCTVKNEADVTIYMDAPGKTINFEQKGVMSPEARVQSGAFQAAFAGGRFRFVPSPMSHQGTITIVRTGTTRSGQCE